MTTLLTTGPSTSADNLELQISCAGKMLDQFCLPEGKSTIGSSPSCQIRLEGSAVRPLQCLIVRKGSEITVTRWAAGILLNDNDFTTATLKLRDRLSVGEFQLSLIDPTAQSEPVESVEEKSVALIDKVTAQVAAEVNHVEVIQEPAYTPTVESVPPTLEAELSKLHAANQQARQRFRKLIGTLRELREESHGLDQHVNVLTEQLQTARKSQENLTSELHQVQAVAEERESQFGEELDRAIAELSSSYEKSNVLEQQWQAIREQNETLHNELSVMVSKAADFDRLSVGWSEEKQRLEAELASREGELSRLYEELSGIKAFFEASVHELQQNSEIQQQRLVATIGEREQEIAQLRQSLEVTGSEQEQFATKIAQCEREIAELRQGLDASKAKEQQFAATIAEREHEISQLHQGLEASVTELHEQNETLRAQLVELSGECDKHQQQANGQAQNLTSLAEANAALQNQLAAAAAEFDRKRIELESRIQAAEQATAEATLKLETPDPFVAELNAELTVVRGERQKLAEDNHRLSGQVAEAEKKIQLLEIDVRSANAEWQQAQATVTKLQEACLTAEANAADLDAKMADLANAVAVEYAGEYDVVNIELANLKKQLAEKDSNLAELQTERDLLGSELVSLKQELVEKEQELAELKTERELLNEQLADLRHQIDLQETSLTELQGERHLSEQEVANLKQELAAKESAAAELLGKRELLDNEITKLGQHVFAKEATLAEIQNERDLLNQEISGFKKELAAKESVLAELKAERDQSISLLNELQQKLVIKEADLTASEQLLNELQTSSQNTSQSNEDYSTELKLRDSRIEELAAELRFAQDQLADCAAQGERLNDLYQQAQLELAALVAAPKVALVEEEPAVEFPVADELPPESPVWPEEDPRDDDESRIVRAMVSAAISTVEAEEDAVEDVTEKEDFKPASFIDQYSHIFDEAGDAPALEPSRAVKPSQDSHLDHGDDSEALEAYMANMMRRVRGESSSEAITPPLSKAAEEPEVSQFSNPVARMNTLTKRVSAVPEPTEPAEGLIDLSELKGTSQKPPLPTSLSAMRELANISARQAIAKHRKRRHFEGALSKLLVSGIAGATAAYMLLTADKFTSPYFMAGCGVAIVSGYWGFKLLGILLEMIRDGINDEHLPAELDDSETALPIDSPNE
jgi:chromosome segregation ATPase